MSEQKSDSGGLFFGDGLAAAAVGLLIRVAIAIWGASRFLPAEDGRFYHVIAGRIANGDGYTWLWPDGVVSYAAHYPVGYPALVGALYAVFGARPIWAMLLSALLGGLSVLAAHQIAATVATRRGALLGAAAVALHPGLVFYTPALMTEGVTASLVALLGWLCVLTRRAPARRGLLLLLALGACFGIVTLVRPQLLLLAPVFGALAAPATRSRLGAAVITTALAVTVCLPWTLRNCQRMDRCVFVSANAGWNLLIGSTEGATGSWVPIEGERVPPSCRSVHGEAAKDRCFGDAALHRILEAPLGFIALTPAKLAVTFDYAGAAGWYLHASNPVLFSERHKEWLGVVETLWQRLILALSLLAVARAEGPRARVRIVLAGLASLFLLVRAAWLAHLGLVLVAGLLGRALLRHPPAALGAATVAATALAHAVFFGAGRYSLVCFAVLGALAGSARRPVCPQGGGREHDSRPVRPQGGGREHDSRPSPPAGRRPRTRQSAEGARRAAAAT